MTQSQSGPSDGGLTPFGRVLLILLSLNGIAAAVGGIAAMRGIMPFPDLWLHGTPFSSSFYPGLLLILAVGGSHFTAAYLIMRRVPSARRVATLAGLILIGWMIGELVLIGFRAPIRAWFFGSGVVELGLSVIKLRRPI